MQAYFISELDFFHKTNWINSMERVDKIKVFILKFSSVFYPNIQQLIIWPARFTRLSTTGLRPHNHHHRSDRHHRNASPPTSYFLLKIAADANKPVTEAQRQRSIHQANEQRRRRRSQDPKRPQRSSRKGWSSPSRPPPPSHNLPRPVPSACLYVCGPVS